MCDYSLMSVPNRLAREGEELVAHRFCTGTMGLASPADLETKADPPARPHRFWSVFAEAFNPPQTRPVWAVCIPPGARLLLRDIPEGMQHKLGVGADEEVTFTQITAAANSYRDAVHFPSGCEILLQGLREGQRIRVLDLSSAEAVEPIKEELVRVRTITLC